MEYAGIIWRSQNSDIYKYLTTDEGAPWDATPSGADKSANKAKAMSTSCVDDHTQYPVAVKVGRTYTPFLTHLTETHTSVSTHTKPCTHTTSHHQQVWRETGVCEQVITINNRANEKAIRCFVTNSDFNKHTVSPNDHLLH